MVLPELLREIENRGVQLVPAGDRLRFRPKRNLTPELVEGLREHKAEILERLEGREQTQTVSADRFVRDAAEVLELARAHFGELEHRERCPTRPREGADPLVHRNTGKARFFRGVRRRDRERRQREGVRRGYGLSRGRCRVSYALEDARRRKRARPLYLELHALGLELVASVDEGGEWCLEIEGLNSLSPAHADRVRVRAQEHERGLLWTLYASWDADLDAIRGELR